VAGQSNTFQILANGSPSPTFALANDGSTLPDGVTLSDTGVLSGSPTQVGVTTFNVVATSSAGSDTETFVLTTNAVAPSLTLAAPRLSYSPTPTVTLTYNNPYLFDFSDPVSINVDLQHDGSFTDPGDQGYATTTLMTGYYKDVTLPALQPGDYAIRATLTDSTGTVYTAYNDITVATAPSGQPMVFEPNVGQTDPSVAYLARGHDYTGFLSASGASFALAPPTGGTAASVFQMSLYGANASATAVGLNAMTSYSDYFLGNDPSQWHTNVANYGGVLFQNVYNNVDVMYTGHQGQMEATFIVNPGGSVGDIALEFGDWGTETVTPDGQLLLHSATGEVMDLSAPVLYQLDASGNKEYVSGQYVTVGNSRAGFMVTGSYDPTRALYIDPTVIFSTYLGGNGPDDGNAIAEDAAGNSYVTGNTRSNNFPTLNAINGTFGQVSTDAFVSAFSPTGALLFSTYLGGTGATDISMGKGIAVDGTGIYVTGQTDSVTFPTTPGAFQTAFRGTSPLDSDAFVTKLSLTGSSLTYSTYLGGPGQNTTGSGIAVMNGHAYVTGQAGSNMFPTTPGVVQSNGNQNSGFLTEMNSTGTALVYSTFICGINNENLANAVALDPSGNAYVTGDTTNFASFPSTPGAFQSYQTNVTGGTGRDAYILKVNPTGTAYVYATLLAGGQDDVGLGIAVNANGNAFVAGKTSSNNFPITPGALQTTFLSTAAPLKQNGFVTEMNRTGTALVYSTYLGGTGVDSANAIAVDSNNDAYITGATGSTNFPVASPTQASPAGGGDAFVTVLNPTGSAAIFSTYLGGSQQDQGNGIALDPANNIAVTGSTRSTDFPTTPGAFQAASGGATDVFVTRFAAVVTPSPPPPPGGTSTVFQQNQTSDTAFDFGTLATGSTQNLSSVAGQQLQIITQPNGLPDYNWWRWEAGGSGTFTATITTTAAVSGQTTPGFLELHLFTLDSTNTLIDLGVDQSLSDTHTLSTQLTAGQVILVEVKGQNLSLGVQDQGVYSMNVQLS
jgi:hypothetical protein